MSRIYDVEDIRRIYEKTNPAGPPKSGSSRNEKAPLQLRGRGDGIHFSGGGGGSRTHIHQYTKSQVFRSFPLISGYYLLYNGVLGNKRIDGGNVLTSGMLRELPPFEGPKVIYGEMSRLSAERLRNERITFKQIPYDLRAR